MIDETIVVHAYFPSYHVSWENGMDILTHEKCKILFAVSRYMTGKI